VTAESQDVVTYVTPEVKAQIGKEGPPATWPEAFERSTLRRYVNATEDPNPLYRDEEFAKKSRFGGLIAPPFWLASLPLAMGQRVREVLHMNPADGPLPGSTPSVRIEAPGLNRGANAGSEIEWFRPVYVGDTLTYQSRVANISERTGRTGPLVITTTETEFRNQRGELVAIMKGSSIRFS
jgi:acyl dehydratase